MESTRERKPYESPAVIYDARMEVHACTRGSDAPPGVLDLFDPANTQ
jgi:hypothetical protein